MNETDFKRGHIEWTTATLNADDLRDKYLSDVWDDGFLAFSREERRLGTDGLKLLSACLSGRSDTVGGPEGYLMEAGLWRTLGTGYEEIALEREGEEFHVQRWRLDTSDPDPDNTYLRCYYRKAGTLVRGNLQKIFGGSLASIEVIVPGHRLRLYLTTEVSA